MTSNDHLDGNEQMQNQDPNDTVSEILNSIASGSQNNTKIRGHRDSDATATDGEIVPTPLDKKITLNDRERAKLYYDKSASMIAPKPQDVPIF